MKTYEIEISSTTYRTYFIDSESQDDAVSRAFDEMEADWEISKAWKRNAEVSFIEEREKDGHSSWKLFFTVASFMLLPLL